MNYSGSLSYLLGLGHEVLTAKFRLENIRTLLEALGNPQQYFHSILIAGTNGKGSVAAMLDAVLREAGLRTGLYTSPHLVTIEERMQVGGEMISPDDFARCATLIRQTSERLVVEKRLTTVPTFFEQVTAIALQHFKESGIELAVLEVGLGGRLDATNAVERLLSIITPIDYDHQNVLGNTIAEIAAEKAAIIHRHARAVLARQRYQEAADVLLNRCSPQMVAPVLVNAPTQIELRDFGRPAFQYQSAQGNLYKVQCGLRGRHQADNAATVIEACETLSQLGYAIPRSAVLQGIKNVRWPGRLELFKGQPHWLLDGAHNLAGAKILKEFLQENWQGQITMLFAMMRDKDISGIAGELFPLADTIIYTKVDELRGASFDEVKAHTSASGRDIGFSENVEEAIIEALRLTPADGLIVVAGSLYLVGAVKKVLQHDQQFKESENP